MPYEMNRTRLTALLEQALEDDEIRSGLDAVLKENDFSKEGLYKTVTDQFMKRVDESTVWQGAESRIPGIGELEWEILYIQESAMVARLAWKRRILIYMGLAAAATAILILSYGVSQGWNDLLPVLLKDFQFAFTILGLLALLLVFYQLAKDQFLKVSADANRKISELEIKIAELIDIADQEVIEAGIKCILREIIGEYLEKSYALQIHMIPHEGLAEVRSKTYDIHTESFAHLNQLLNNMRGGSIGLAGPRGSGKTTIMDSFCKVHELDQKKRHVLPVMTSAPVTYDAREFIILIYKLVCKAFLAEMKVKEQYFSDITSQEFRNAGGKWVRSLSEVLNLVGPRTLFFLMISGSIMVVLALALSLEGIYPPAASPALTATSPATAPVIGTPGASPGNLIPITGINIVFQKLGITSANLFHWGAILLLVALSIIIGKKGLQDRKRSLEREKARQENEIGTNRMTTQNEGNTISEDQRMLVYRAEKALKDLRFQQSYSSGWSGSLNLPLGLESGIENSMELAQYQLSVPEIIEEYRRFIRDLSSAYTIIIGIDELDKIGTAEDAFKFLNGIKALFGIDDCFYLLSVSENAMSSFERRGLPIRNALDSSFDKIVYVDYLDYKISLRLLNRRVIGIPIPFLAFCYCMSGGLPRDLIRSCRTVFEILSQDETRNSLAEIVNTALKDDMRLKLHAVAIAAKQSPAVEEANKVVAELYRLEGLLLDSSGFPYEANKLLQNRTLILAPVNGTEKLDDNKKKLVSLIEELGTYLNYLETLHEYFTHLEIEKLKLDESKQLDRLARARQLFAYSLSESRKVITDFRLAHQMEVFEDRPREKASYYESL